MLLGFGGALPHLKKCAPRRGGGAALSLENIVLETDCPLMAPEPFRGKRMPFGHDPLHSPESGGHQAGAFGGSAAYNRTERPRAAGRINGPHATRSAAQKQKAPRLYHLENGRRELISQCRPRGIILRGPAPFPIYGPENARRTPVNARPSRSAWPSKRRTSPCPATRPAHRTCRCGTPTWTPCSSPS